MRLTLRTLLAWLDNVLPASEQKQLGEKVTASPVAQQLVDRIRLVVERPQVGAPRPDGRGLAADANSVAEYLDNTLEHERLEPLERICLESDMHLAEVAACHTLLAELAEDPSVVEPLDQAGRSRLLAALRHLPQPQTPVPAKPTVRPAEPAHLPAGTLPQVERPSLRRPAAPWRAWLAGGAALAALVALGLFFASAAGLLRWGRPTAVGEVPLRGEGVAPGRELAGAEPIAEEPAGRPEPEAAAAVEPDGAPAAPVLAPATEPAPQEIAIEIEVDAGLEAAVPENAPPAAVGSVGSTGLILRRATGAAAPGWLPAAVGRALERDDELLVPPGFHPDLQLGEASVRLLPRTQASIAVDADGTPRMVVLFGRAVVQLAPGQPLGISAGGLVGSCVAAAPAAVAVEVRLEREPGAEPPAEGGWARLTALAGPLAWQQGTADQPPAGGWLEGVEREVTLTPEGALEWHAQQPHAAAVLRAGPVPAWVRSASRIDPLEAGACGALVARLASLPAEPAAAAAAFQNVLRTMASDRRVENRMLAAGTLALADDFEPLVDLLCSETPGLQLAQGQWSVLEAATVPAALGRGAESAARLRQAFATRGPGGKADLLSRLARGFSAADLAVGGVELLSGLDDSSLVVRRYAYKCLLESVQPAGVDRLRYRPDGLPELRREGIQWWRGQAEKGLLRWAEPRHQPSKDG
jgi:hypothetical protein